MFAAKNFKNSSIKNWLDNRQGWNVMTHKSTQARKEGGGKSGQLPPIRKNFEKNHKGTPLYFCPKPQVHVDFRQKFEKNHR
jgi:hypothetical protein